MMYLIAVMIITTHTIYVSVWSENAYLMVKYAASTPITPPGRIMRVASLSYLSALMYPGTIAFMSTLQAPIMIGNAQAPDMPIARTVPMQGA